MILYTDSALRDSGVTWLGKVPTHWSINRLGGFFIERREKVSDKDFPPLSVTKNGIVPQLETAAKTDDGDNRKGVRAGDFVINGRSDRKGSSGLSRMDGSVSLINIVLQPRNISGQFIHHLFRSYPFQEEFYRYGKGIVADLWSTNYSEMKNILIPVPSHTEQEAIAAFLDHKTALIDDLIDKRERQIELLQEQREALISREVFGNTKDPVKKIGYYINLLPGYSFPSDGFSQNENDTKLLRGINVGTDFIRWDETVYWPINKTQAVKEYALEAGDLVLGMDRPWIAQGTRVAEVKKEDLPALLVQRVCRLRAKPGLRQEFLKLVIASKEFRVYIEGDLTGISVPHISADQICSFKMRLPNETRQNTVWAHLRTQLERVDKSIRDATDVIQLLRDYRNSLISVAVTGKIDVRNWQPSSESVEESLHA